MLKKITVWAALLSALQVATPLLAYQDSAGSGPTPPAAAPSNQGATTARHAIGFQDPYPRYQLMAGDTMDLVFEFSPEFNQTVNVQPDGFISLRGVGDMHVSSKTVPQLIAALQTAYGKILSDPAISVVLKDYERPYFIATGQVGHPGKFVLHGETTVTEGVALAGGFTEKSKHSNVVLFRRVSSQWTEARVLNVKEMLKAKNLSEDLILRPGDMIYVPQNAMSKIARFIPTAQMSTYISPQSF